MLPTMNAATAGGAEPAPRPPAVADAAVTTELALPRGCPFLLAAAGGWRLDLPSREHRCAAVSPPSPLAVEKQSRLCLTDTHTSCATFVAALEARAERLGSPPNDRATRWGLARTTTVIQDPGGVRARALGAVLDRGRWPAIPAVLLVTTLFALAVSGFRPSLPATAVATASPTTTSVATLPPARTAAPIIVPTAAPTIEPTIAPTPVPTAPPTAPPTAAPTKAPEPTFRTYTVERNDTLSAIAARFGTTVQAIVNLNNLPNANQLSIGQVLLIPNPPGN